MTEEVKQFASQSEALRYFNKLMRDLDYADNQRYAIVGNEMQEHAYEEARRNGCCGSMDIKVMVGENEFLMGCNYGH